MGREVSFDYSKAAGFVNQEELDNLKDTVLFAKHILVNRTGAGNDFLGWIDLPVDRGICKNQRSGKENSE